MRSKFILGAAALMLSSSAFAQQNVGTNGTRYSLLIEGTGAWCMHCSDGAVFVEEVLSKTPKAIAISEHNADGMSFPDGDALDAALNSGWPWGSVDMHYFGSGGKLSLNRSQWQGSVNSQLALPAQADLTMTHSYDQGSRTLTVKVTGKALAALTGKYSLNVYLTEDSVVGPAGNNYSQTNAMMYDTLKTHKYYHANNNAAKTKIDGFKHMQVLRAMLGGVWGQQATENPAANATFSKTFTYVIPAKYDVLNVKLDKLKLVAVIHKTVTATPTATSAPDILNSVQAKVLPWNTTGIPTISNFSEVNLYPNPASTTLGIQALLNEPAPTTVTISNAVGQVVFSKTYPAGGSMFAESISLENMTNGLYLVNITSNGSTTTEKLVVNK